MNQGGAAKTANTAGPFTSPIYVAAIINTLYITYSKKKKKKKTKYSRNAFSIILNLVRNNNIKSPYLG